jgi:hypothetical protein
MGADSRRGEEEEDQRRSGREENELPCSKSGKALFKK